MMAVNRLFNANTSACSAKCQPVSHREYNRPLNTAAETEEDNRMLVQAMTAAAAAVTTALKKFMRHATPNSGMRREASLYEMQNKGYPAQEVQKTMQPKAAVGSRLAGYLGDGRPQQCMRLQPVRPNLQGRLQDASNVHILKEKRKIL